MTTGVARAAARLRAAGLAVCKIRPPDKQPGYNGWSEKSLEPADFGDGDMIGILGGPLSDGGKPGHALVLIDLDAAEAVARADAHLPPTSMIEGRPGKRRSHRGYLVPVTTIPHWAVSTADKAAPAAAKAKGHAGPLTKSFRHRETNAEVLRFIGTGGLVVCPPSVWTSKDRTRTEVREWEGGEPGEAGVVEFSELWRACGELASACGAAVPDVMPRPPRGRARRPDAPLLDRALAYLAKCSPAVSGQGGHSRLFAAARAMVYGFDLGTDVAFELLRDEYNPRCEPPWSERELQHKVEDADRLPYGKPRGHLRGVPGPEWNGATHHGNGQTKATADADAPGVSPVSELVVESLSGLRPKPVIWNVPGRIPAGMLGLLAGEGGHGKTMTTLELAAAFTAGRCAFGLTYPNPTRGEVLLISCEDDWERTIVPRLIALGADLSRVLRVKGVRMKSDGKTLDFHLGHFRELERLLDTKKDIRLVVIDPAGAYVGRAGVNENKDAELRALLGPLSEMANRTGATLILVKHLNKNAGVSAVQRVSGSAGYVNASRFAYMIAPDPADPGRKLMLATKNNLGLRGDGLAYRMTPIPPNEARAILTAAWSDLDAGDLAELSQQLVRQAWEDGITADPNDIAGAARKRETLEETAGRCAAFIREFLGAYAWPDTELEAAAKEAGFSGRALSEAKARLRSPDKSDSNRLSSKPRGAGGPWWVWIGPQGDRPPDRPVSHTDQTALTGQTGQTDHSASSSTNPLTTRGVTEIRQETDQFEQSGQSGQSRQWRATDVRGADEPQNPGGQAKGRKVRRNDDREHDTRGTP
jgi:AAA domain